MAGTTKKTAKTAEAEAIAAAIEPQSTADRSPKKPEDRKPTSRERGEQRAAEKKQAESVKKFMADGVDFSPIVLNPGDGTEWSFTPDPQPAQSARLAKAMQGLEGVDDPQKMEEVFETLADSIRERLVSEEEREKFPLPIYGVNALMWFGMRMAAGRDDFPTE